MRTELREVLLDPDANAKPESAEVSEWILQLDESKREAVKLALGATDLLLVQGPPGTGKTSFIAETVAQYLRSNPQSRVLIASQTHVAVDNALERLELSGIGGLVRLAGVDQSRVDPTVLHLLLDAQTKRWARRVRARVEQSVERQAKGIGVVPDHLRAALVLQQLASVIREIEAIEKHVTDDTGESSEPSELSTALDAASP